VAPNILFEKSQESPGQESGVKTQQSRRYLDAPKLTTVIVLSGMTMTRLRKEMYLSRSERCC
jgi:hypothetical protein